MTTSDTRLRAPAALPAVPSGHDQARLLQWLETIRSIQVRHLDQGHSAHQLTAALSEAIDALLVTLWCAEGLDQTEISLVGIGGYGRGELFPRSDVDLLILVEANQTLAGLPTAEALNRFITRLWDLKLDVGHAVRDVSECIRIAEADVVSFTAMLESRLIQGHDEAFGDYQSAIQHSGLWQPQAYLDAKLDEQVRRHNRFFDTVHRLEPNLKEGPGGLRDWQTLLWISRYSMGLDDLEALTMANYLDAAEARETIAAAETLMRMRFALHQSVGQKEERLLFSWQLRLAERLIDEDEDPDVKRVERLMQRYFKAATRIRQLNQNLIGSFRRNLSSQTVKVLVVNQDYQISNGELEFTSEQLIRHDPMHLIGLFVEFSRNPDAESISYQARRLLKRHREEMPNLRQSDAARQLFRQIWSQLDRLTLTLGQMHECDLLGAYLGEFSHTIGHMQFDMFHEFTVDRHTLMVLGVLDRFRRNERLDAYPLAHDVWKRLNKPHLMYVAGFFHDIAKGLGGDHSELGAQIVTDYAQAHGYTTQEIRLLAWLVRHHLLMSITAQKRDISDPDVIHDFASKVGNLAYLNYLYLLTMADISGTSRKLWNTWRASLLSDLYRRTRAALERGLGNPLQREDQISDVRFEALQRLQPDEELTRRVLTLWDSIADDYFLRHAADQIEWHTRQFIEATGYPIVAIRDFPDRGATEVFVYSENRDGVLTTIVSTLTQLGLNILNAKSVITADGYLIDTFLVVDLAGQPLGDLARSDRLRHRLLKYLGQDELQIPEVTRPVPGRIKSFERRARISFPDHADGSDHTLLEFRGLEEPGLLARILRVFLDQEIRVHKIQVATFGEAAEDYFWLSDYQGQALGDAQKRALRQSLEKIRPA